MNLGLFFTELESSSKENVNGVSGIKERLCNYNSSASIVARYSQDGPGFEPRQMQEIFSSSYP